MLLFSFIWLLCSLLPQSDIIGRQFLRHLHTTAVQCKGATVQKVHTQKLHTLDRDIDKIRLLCTNLLTLHTHTHTDRFHIQNYYKLEMYSDLIVYHLVIHLNNYCTPVLLLQLEICHKKEITLCQDSNVL